MESNESNNSNENETIGEKGYDKGMCAILKVPCRFVSDHPCCDVSLICLLKRVIQKFIKEELYEYCVFFFFFFFLWEFGPG